MQTRKVRSAILHSSPQIVGYSNLKNQLSELRNQAGTIRDLEMSFDGDVLLVTINKVTEAAIPAANVVSMVFGPNESLATKQPIPKAKE